MGHVTSKGLAYQVRPPFFILFPLTKSTLPSSTLPLSLSSTWTRKNTIYSCFSCPGVASTQLPSLPCTWTQKNTVYSRFPCPGATFNGSTQPPFPSARYTEHDATRRVHPPHVIFDVTRRVHPHRVIFFHFRCDEEGPPSSSCTLFIFDAMRVHLPRCVIHSFSMRRGGSTLLTT